MNDETEDARKAYAHAPREWSKKLYGYGAAYPRWRVMTRRREIIPTAEMPPRRISRLRWTPWKTIIASNDASEILRAADHAATDRNTQVRVYAKNAKRPTPLEKVK